MPALGNVFQLTPVDVNTPIVTTSINTTTTAYAPTVTIPTTPTGAPGYATSTGTATGSPATNLPAATPTTTSSAPNWPVYLLFLALAYFGFREMKGAL